MIRKNIKNYLQEEIDDINSFFAIYDKRVTVYKLYEVICSMIYSIDEEDIIEDDFIYSIMNITYIYDAVFNEKDNSEELIANNIDSVEKIIKKCKEMSEFLFYIKGVKEKNYQEIYDTKKAIKRFNSDVQYFYKKREFFKKLVDNNKLEAAAKKIRIKKCLFLKSKLDHDGLLTKDDILFIIDFMNEKGLEKVEQIFVLEYIGVHNKKIKYPNYKEDYTVPEMLRISYKEMPISNIQSILLSKYKSDIFSYLKSLEKISSLEKTIKALDAAEEEYENIEHYFFILKSLINEFVHKLNEDIEDIKEHYNDFELRKVIKITYKEHKRVYGFLKKLYNEKLKKVKEKGIGENKTVVNELYYAGKGTPYFESDLKRIPQEKLLEVKTLLEKKKYGTITQDEDQPLNNNLKLKGLKELRGDQVRICYRHLGFNRYVIMGVFLKKTDNDQRAYEAMANRKVDIMLGDENQTLQELLTSQAIEQRIFDYIDKNHRKGSR